MERDKIMVNFDVVSLFMKVPVDDALQAISVLLGGGDDTRTTIPICSHIREPRDKYYNCTSL